MSVCFYKKDGTVKSFGVRNPNNSANVCGSKPLKPPKSVIKQVKDLPANERTAILAEYANRASAVTHRPANDRWDIRNRNGDYRADVDDDDDNAGNNDFGDGGGDGNNGSDDDDDGSDDGGNNGGGGDDDLLQYLNEFLDNLSDGEEEEDGDDVQHAIAAAQQAAAEAEEAIMQQQHQPQPRGRPTARVTRSNTRGREVRTRSGVLRHTRGGKMVVSGVTFHNKYK